MSEAARQCTACGEVKPISDFTVRKDGYIRGKCRCCVAKAERKKYWREKGLAMPEKKARVKPKPSMRLMPVKWEWLYKRWTL